MARQVLPIIGAAVGFVASGFNPMGAQWGYLAGPAIGCIAEPTITRDPLEYLDELDHRSSI